MSNTIITIARSYGSGGRKLGQRLAEKMQIEYYDRNLIYLASDKSGVDARFFSEHDESVKQSFFEKLGRIVPPASRRFSSQDNVFRFQQRMIRDLANKSDCVIIGRCASYALRDSGHKVIRVFVWAPHNDCVRTVMNKFSISEEEADKTIRDINKHRSEYYKFYTGRDWESAKNYDLIINTSEYTEESATDLIKSFAAIYNK